MTSLLQLVTPLTRGLLWFRKEEIKNDTSYYKDVDYLLNGLLTARLSHPWPSGPLVLVSENFGNQFYVIIGNSISEKEITSYFELIKSQLTGESNLLLIDEMNCFNEIQKLAPDDLRSKIHLA